MVAETVSFHLRRGSNKGENKVKQRDFIKLKDVWGISENIHYSTLYKDIPPEFMSYTEKELKETAQNKAKGMQELRDFLKKENIPDVEESTLLFVLRNCKYDMKKSKAKLKKFLHVRNFVFKRVAELDLKILETIFEDMPFGVLPYRDKHGRAIMFTRPSLNLDLYSIDDVAITALASTLFLLDSYPMISLTGVVYIADSKCGPTLLYQILKAALKYVPMWLDTPLRIARIEITNEYSVTRFFVRVLRPLLSPKIRDRFRSHGSNLESLQEDFHPDLLPEEFGGNLGPLNEEFFKTEVLNFIKKIKEKCQQ